MKYVFLILSFSGAPLMAMKRSEYSDGGTPILVMVQDDYSEQQQTNLLERSDTIKIINSVPPKKARALSQSRSAADYDEEHKKWNNCAEPFDVMGFHINGYVVFMNNNLMKGTAVTQDLKTLHYKTNPDVEQLRMQLASNYKIHLMPFDDDIVPIMLDLLGRIKEEPQLQQAVNRFKIHAHTDAIQRDDGTYLPIFVIYCHAGKDAAQYVLNEVYALFKDKRGVDITPRYNRKITSLIYYAQGDGDRKGENYANYYEEGLVHYHPKFEGEIKDYWLKNPAENI
jgi:hypothetical protein